jgi:hypothetical protein
MVADGESPERSWGVDSGLGSLSAPFDLFSAGGVVHLVDDRVVAGLSDLVLACALEVLRDGGGEHPDVAEFFRGGLHQQLAAFGFILGHAEGLKHVLKRDAHLAFRAADGLLEHLRELRVGLFDFDLILQRFVMKERLNSINSDEREANNRDACRCARRPTALVRFVGRLVDSSAIAHGGDGHHLTARSEAGPLAAHL